MTVRLTPQFIAAAAFLVTLTAFAVGLVVIDRSGEMAIARQQAAIARSARDYFLGFAREEGAAALAKALNRRERSGSADGFRYALLNADGTVAAGADVVGDLDTPDNGWGTVMQTGDGPRRAWRVLAAKIGPDQTLVVAEDLAARDGFRAALLRGSTLALLLTGVAVMGLGLAINAMLYGRAKTIGQAAEQIAAGNLGARAAVRPGGDVFDHLGESINAMLTRIETLMTGMRTVTDSVTHDLRSPLTRMRSALSRALDPAMDERTRLDAICEAQAEADRALATLSALVDIVNAESGLSRELMESVDVGALVAEMGELFSPVVEDAGQSLTVDVEVRPLVAVAHELLLRQAIGNLLYNAAVHAGEGARVTMSVRRADRVSLVVTVADNGVGVPDDQLGRVTERFVRLDEARSRPGSGLGLSIAAACAKLHGGRLLLTDNQPGLSVAIELAARETDRLLPDRPSVAG